MDYVMLPSKNKSDSTEFLIKEVSIGASCEINYEWDGEGCEQREYNDSYRSHCFFSLFHGGILHLCFASYSHRLMTSHPYKFPSNQVLT